MDGSLSQESILLLQVSFRSMYIQNTVIDIFRIIPRVKRNEIHLTLSQEKCLKELPGCLGRTQRRIKQWMTASILFQLGSQWCKGKRNKCPKFREGSISISWVGHLHYYCYYHYHHYPLKIKLIGG